MLDTTFLVRYLTSDPQHQADVATAIIDSDRSLVVSTIALTEVWYVLRDLYHVPREDALEAMIDLLARTNLQVLGLPKGRVIEALSMLRPSGRVSIADALMWAEAREEGLSMVYSFDKRFPSEGLDVRRH